MTKAANISRNLPMLRCLFLFVITNLVLRKAAAFSDITLGKPWAKRGHAVEVAAHKTASYDGSSFRVVRCFPNLSRREAERAVTDGRVRVNGQTVAPSYRLAGGETLTLDNRKVQWEDRALAMENRNQSNIADNQQVKSSRVQFVYYKYHKPVGVTCTMDKHDRRGLYYSLPSGLRRKEQRLFPVGRLDLDSQGLVLLTNDGRLADALLQPRNKQEKEYIVTVRPALSHEKIAKLESGVVITTVQQRGGQETTAKTKPCTIDELGGTGSTYNAGEIQELRFVLCEGRNRQIRKMVKAVASQVVSLTRVRHGIVALGELPSGAAVAVRGGELEQLLKSIKSGGGQRRGPYSSQDRRRPSRRR